jgi:hypothetical protein
MSSGLLRATGDALTYWCHGCNDSHTVKFGPGDGPRWSFPEFPEARRDP